MSIDANNKISLSGCNNGEILKWNGSNWKCAPDKNATYTAGAGLALNSGEFSVDPSSLADNAIPASKVNGVATLSGPQNFQGSVSAAGFQYNTTKNVTKMVIPASFELSRGKSEDDVLRLRSDGGSYISDPGTDGTAKIELQAQVEMPDHAQVTGFGCMIYDNDSTDNITSFSAHLRRQGILGPLTSSMEMASLSASTSGTSTIYSAPSTTTISYASVDSDIINYHIDVSLAGSAVSADLRFYGCYVNYQVDGPRYN